MLLSVQRALLGEVGDNLRAVAADLDDHGVLLTFLTVGPPTEDDVETASVVGTEVTADMDPADLDAGLYVREEVLHVPFPHELLPGKGTYIFERRPPEYDE